MTDAGWQPARRKPSIPLTLLTGPLGAGKTTLLNRLLRDPAFADTAVILNEAGSVGLVEAPAAESADGIVALGAGCVCCTIRGALVEALERLLRGLDNGRIAVIARVVVETAGEADPAAIFALLTRHPYLALRFHLDGIVTVIDATAGGPGLTDPATARQVASADRIVLTRTTGAPDAAAFRAAIVRSNPGALILDAERDDFTAAAFIGIADDVLHWLAADAVAAHPGSDAFVIARDASMSRGALEAFLDEAARHFGPSLARVKGIVALTGSPARPALVNGIGGVFALPVLLPSWPDTGRYTRLVVTGLHRDRQAFTTLCDAHAGALAIDTPDRAAVMDNPLAVPGLRRR